MMLLLPALIRRALATHFQDDVANEPCEMRQAPASTGSARTGVRV
jgi:hypothetical protein